jgi:hypothetical protein
MTDILTIHLPVPVPAIKTISRWRVFLALFNPRFSYRVTIQMANVSAPTPSTLQKRISTLGNIA